MDQVAGDPRGRAVIAVLDVSGSTRTRPTESPSDQIAQGPGWTTVVWNDPVNLMSYVTYVFRSYFGYPPAKAEQLMLQVHEAGKATVSRGPRERMEVDVQAMHAFGLWATVQDEA